MVRARRTQRMTSAEADVDKGGGFLVGVGAGHDVTHAVSVPSGKPSNTRVCFVGGAFAGGDKPSASGDVGTHTVYTIADTRSTVERARGVGRRVL